MQNRGGITRKAEFELFLNWLLGKHSQAEITKTSTGRTLRRNTAWCWNVCPQPTVTGQIHDQIMLDGTYFNTWCVLIAYTGDHVVDWQWCDREKVASWSALLGRIPPPTIAVVDGHQGLLSAMKTHWPTTKVQRCLFHIRHGAHRHLTRRPTLPAGKELLALVKALSDVTNLDQAAAWMGQYGTWDGKWAAFLAHRTHANQSTKTVPPTHVRIGQKWWYTHDRLRKARYLIATTIKAGHLFTWLEHAQEDQVIARTTSPLEGGINAGIKQLLRVHRGLSEHHAKRAVDWYLYLRTQHPADPWELVKADHWQPPKKAKPAVVEEQIGPARYDTGLTADEGLWTRKGWAGRT